MCIDFEIFSFFRLTQDKAPLHQANLEKKGKIDATCGCFNHDLLAEGKSFSLLKITDSMARFESFQILLKKGLIKKHKMYICNKYLK